MSLRLRLVLGMVLVSSVLVVTAFAVTRTTERHLVDQIDAQLRSTAASGVVVGGDHGPDHHGGGQLPARPGGISSLYSAAITSDGNLTTLTESKLTGSALPYPEIPASRLRSSAPATQIFNAGTKGSDLRYRVLLQQPDQGRGYSLVLALPLSDVEAAVSRLVQVELVVTLSVLALLALVTFWVLRLGVRPIKQMTQTAKAIAGGDLSHRVPEGDPHTEAGELGLALNGMLMRIEEAFDERSRSENRLRRFVADASHELRTPVTTIRGYAELYRAGGLVKREALDDAMRRTEQESIRMGTLVDDMLLLARLDQGRPLDAGPVDLGALAEDAAQDARAVQPGRPITAHVGAGVEVVGDEGRLRQVIANLVTNALQHTPLATAVDITVARVGDRVALDVADAGPGMAPDIAERIFERFFRADPSRSRHQGGSGLGLSIAKAITEAHGGRISLDSAVGRGTTVRIELPITHHAAPTDAFGSDATDAAPDDRPPARPTGPPLAPLDTPPTD
ncbi:MAG: sensor histidine kinase [Acidimicrobiales bacterium]|nr:sensor histidine kinase [Acidimicrobiales bacterium]